MALPIGPLPFTLTNGTLADANQVMANFNTLLNGVNNLAPLSAAIVGGTSNVVANIPTASTTVTVTADSVTVGVSLAGASYTLTTYSQVFNGATTGAGGMDVGAIPTSGFVALYAIYNPTAPAISILGKNAGASAPTIYNGSNMPAGYTASALLAIIPTNATPAMQPGYVQNRSWQYQSPVQVLNNSTNQGSLTSLSLTGATPPNGKTVFGFFQFTSTAGVGQVAAALSLAADNVHNTISYNVETVAGVSQTWSSPFPPLMTPTAQTIFYATANISANLGLNINISGYTW